MENDNVIVERAFNPSSRYEYDNNLLPKLYAQVDTEQDAAYYGMWANPYRLQIVEYCEGDETISTFANEDAFVAHLRGYKLIKGIDPGFNERLKSTFIKLGLEDFIQYMPNWPESLKKQEQERRRRQNVNLKDKAS